MELWFNDFQNSTSLLVILEIIPGGDHAWPAWMSPTGHSSQQSMETGWAPPADSWSQCVCWSPYLLGAGSVKLGCLAQIPASWGPSVINVDGEWRVSLTERYHGGDKWNQSHVLHPVGHWYPLPYLTRYGEGQPSTFVPGSIRISGVAYFLDARCVIISWWMNRFTKWDIVPMTPWIVSLYAGCAATLCMRAVLPSFDCMVVPVDRNPHRALQLLKLTTLSTNDPLDCLSVCGLCCHSLAAWWYLWIVTHTEPCSCWNKQLCQQQSISICLWHHARDFPQQTTPDLGVLVYCDLTCLSIWYDAECTGICVRSTEFKRRCILLW